MRTTFSRAFARGIRAVRWPHHRGNAVEVTSDARRFDGAQERAVEAGRLSPGLTSLRNVLLRSEPVEGYPLERVELVLLARHWAATSLDLSLASFVRGRTGPTELGLHRLAAERLGRIGQLLGEGAIASAVDEADAECREALGERLWDLFRNGDEEARAAVREELLGVEARKGGFR